MDYKDYYKILGLERNAGADDIRRSYRKLAMQYHPDRNQGDRQAEEKFKEINEAYQVLSDPQKRARYDQLGSAYSNWERRGGSPGDFDWSQWFNQAQRGGERGGVDDLFGEGPFSEFFRSIFGGAGVGQAPSRSRAYQQAVTISLEEAYHGAARSLQSNGRRMEVRIPPGVKTGSKVRVAGAGPEGLDLYLIVDVAQDARFERKDNDLHTSAAIDAFSAILGGEVQVETLAGKVTLKIPPGTQPDQVFRLAGRGMPQLKNPQTKGDLFVKVKVRIPKQLSPKLKTLLEEAARLKPGQ
jgi:curved DNA-binding protein